MEKNKNKAAIVCKTKLAGQELAARNVAVSAVPQQASKAPRRMQGHTRALVWMKIEGSLLKHVAPA